MLAHMLERVFLGWDRPFTVVAANWLLARRDELPEIILVVPTSQGGRRLREALVESAGALLTPRIMTPGSFLKTTDPTVAPDWIERVAWVETLEQTGDSVIYQDIFPAPPEDSHEWAGGLSMEMTNLRRSLQENGHTLTSAARMLSGTVENARWSALARLEAHVEKRLRSWGYKSRSHTLAAGLVLPHGPRRIVLAGITEMPPLLECALLAARIPVSVLIGAPDSEAESFSAIGRPLPCWSERVLPWPEGNQGSVQLVADARQQAQEAFRVTCKSGFSSNETALGTADSTIGDEIARIFTRGGWTAFHPAAAPVKTGLARWFKAWSGWLAAPKPADLTVLLSLPETTALVGNRRTGLAERLSRLRNDWMIMGSDDLRQRIASGNFRSDPQKDSAMQVLEAITLLERWRGDFLGADFAESMHRLLNTLEQSTPEIRDESRAFHDWLDEAAPLIHQVDRNAAYWTDLMLSTLQAPAPTPPEGRVIDVLGWLELFLEPGRHLVLCGMNEGSVPARNGSDPWLGESAARILGLNLDATRAARDAFLYQSMVEARRHDGRVDLICAKSGGGGESLLPSRLLLAANRKDLPQRVRFLFKEIAPPESGIRWQADWKWQPRSAEPLPRLSATSLSTYLACPFRYYLKHGIGMQSPEPGRVEWNARDFGNVAHDLLERWGRDPEAREFSKTEAIHTWLSAGLDDIVAEWFGKRPPLAVRLQTEVLRQRLAWLARVQACSRAEGWEIIEVEHKFEIPVGDAVIIAKIDRIDRHRESGELRVIDYKTGKVDTVEKSHRRKITAATTLPSHILKESPAIYSGEDKGKPTDFLWLNLQLPLYAVAVKTRNSILPTPCYFTLGATEADVDIHAWQDFSKHDLQSANHCAEWIAAQIAAKVFWPPAEKVLYDDFSVLSSGRNFDEVFSPPLASV